MINLKLKNNLKDINSLFLKSIFVFFYKIFNTRNIFNDKNFKLPISLYLISVLTEINQCII